MELISDTQAARRAIRGIVVNKRFFTSLTILFGVPSQYIPPEAHNTAQDLRDLGNESRIQYLLAE